MTNLAPSYVSGVELIRGVEPPRQSAVTGSQALLFAER